MLLCPSVDGYLGSFPLWAVVNYATGSTYVLVRQCLIASLGHTPSGDTRV